MAQSFAGSDPSHETNFIGAVGYGLSLLGESGKKAIYYYLEKNYNIKKCNMCAKLENFSNALDRTFGVGSIFIKVLIMKKCYENIHHAVRIGSV
jgi:hypothetical protein